MDTALSETLPDGSTIVLEYNWSSSEGTDVMVNKITEAPSGMLDTEELFHTENVPREWHLGHFTSDDVIKKFGPQFFRYVQEERTKSYMKTLPPVGGKGRGWHGERERHRQAAKKGKR